MKIYLCNAEIKKLSIVNVTPLTTTTHYLIIYHLFLFTMPTISSSFFIEWKIIFSHASPSMKDLLTFESETIGVCFQQRVLLMR